MKQSVETNKSENKPTGWGTVDISMYYPPSLNQGEDDVDSADSIRNDTESKEKEGAQPEISHDVGRAAVDNASKSVDDEGSPVAKQVDRQPDFADIRRRLNEYRRADEQWARSVDDALKEGSDKTKADLDEARTRIESLTEDIDKRIAAMSKRIGGLVIPGLEMPKLHDNTDKSTSEEQTSDKQLEMPKANGEKFAESGVEVKGTETGENALVTRDEREPVPDYDKRIVDAINLVRDEGFAVTIPDTMQTAFKEALGGMVDRKEITWGQARDLHARMSTAGEAWADVANPNDLARQTADKAEKARVEAADKSIAERDVSSAETEKIPVAKPEKVAVVLTDKEKADALKYTNAIPEVFGDVDGVRDALKSRDRIAKLIRKKGPESDGRWNPRDRANYEQWQHDITYFASQFGRRYAEQMKGAGGEVTASDVSRWTAVFTKSFDRSVQAKADEGAKKSLGGRIKGWLQKHLPHKADKAPKVEVITPGRKPNQKQIAKRAVASAEAGIKLSSGRTVSNGEWADYIKRYQTEKAAEQETVTFEVVDRPKLHYDADNLPRAKYQAYRSKDKNADLDMSPRIPRDQAEIAKYFDESAVDNTDQLAIYAAHLLDRDQLSQLRYDGDVNHLAGTLTNNPKLRTQSLNMLQELKDKGLSIDIIQAIGGNWISYDLDRRHGKSVIMPTEYTMGSLGSEQRAASRIYYRDNDGGYHYMVVNLANGCVIDPPKGKGIADLHDPLLRISK